MDGPGVLDQQLDPVTGGQTVALDVDEAPAAGHAAVRVQPRVGATGGRVEAALVDVERLDDLSLDMSDQDRRRGVGRGDQASRGHEPGEKAHATARPRLLTPAPQGDLGDGHAHQQQQDGRLDVGPVGDRELVVRLGEEEVEPHPARQGRADPGGPAPGGRGAHHDEHQDQSDVGVRHVVPERCEHSAHHQRGGQRRRHHQGGPARPRPHPSINLPRSRRCQGVLTGS